MVSVWSAIGRARAAVRDVGLRFPLPIAMGVAGAALGWALMIPGVRGRHSDDVVTNLLLSVWLGVSLFLCAALAAERRRGAGEAGAPSPSPSSWSWLWSLAALAPCVACFAGLHGEWQPWRIMRFALWMIAAHGLVAILPVAPVGGRAARPAAGDFRAFNVLLFTRAVGGLVITHVLFAGLSFALQAINKLFDVHVPSWTYGCLWFALVGVVNTVYVLAGIPRGWDRLAGAEQPPQLLNVLARYVLLPLSALYLVILYVYSARIIWMHEWPRGWVSAPIIVFSAVGLLTVLLLGPDGDRGTRFVRAYCKGFFVAVMPLVVLLFMAISRRAGEYGLTEERCVVYAIAVFLGLIAPYFVFSRERRLASIPIVLGAIALATSVGPLSAASLSLRSQTGRLRALLASNHLLERPRGSGVRPKVTNRDEAQLSAVLRFLDERGQMKVVAKLGERGGPECGPCAGWRAETPTPAAFMVSLGLTYRPWGPDSADDTSTFYARHSHVVDTKGFDVMLDDFNCDLQSCRLSWGEREGGSAAGWKLELEPGGLRVDGHGRRLGTIPLDRLRAQAEAASGAGGDARHDVDPKQMAVEGGWDRGGYRLLATSLTVKSVKSVNSNSKIESIAGRLLVRFDPP